MSLLSILRCFETEKAAILCIELSKIGFGSCSAIEYAWEDRREERTCLWFFDWNDLDFVCLFYLRRKLVNAAAQCLHASSDPNNDLNLGLISSSCALSNQHASIFSWFPMLHAFIHNIWMYIHGHVTDPNPTDLLCFEIIKFRYDIRDRPTQLIYHAPWQNNLRTLIRY